MRIGSCMLHVAIGELSVLSWCACLKLVIGERVPGLALFCLLFVQPRVGVVGIGVDYGGF